MIFFNLARLNVNIYTHNTILPRLKHSNSEVSTNIIVMFILAPRSFRNMTFRVRHGFIYLFFV